VVEHCLHQLLHGPLRLLPRPCQQGLDIRLADHIAHGAFGNVFDGDLGTLDVEQVLLCILDAAEDDEVNVVDQVQLQKVGPPDQVIDASRDVQAARADKERLQNEAGSYANRVVPKARGEAERILQAALAYREQTVADATGQSARFLKVYEEYKKASEVTRRRMYLETIERVLGGADKIILDSRSGQGVVPYLSLDQLQKGNDGSK